jgi:hypothetical protein
VSGFRETGAKEDEGQFLQSVYSPGHVYGGPGRFAFHPAARLTEDSSLVSDANRRQLIQEWSRFWDLDKPVLIEKSPPNVVRTRFLQALFPRAAFVVLVRHPVPVALATQKWSRTSLSSLLDHWLVSHTILREDKVHLERVLTLRFEDFIRNPHDTLGVVLRFLELDAFDFSGDIRADANERYFRRWKRRDAKWPYRRLLDRKFESRVNDFGYSLRDLRSVSGAETGAR